MSSENENKEQLISDEIKNQDDEKEGIIGGQEGNI